MTKYIIIANWKSNPDAPGRAAILAHGIEEGIQGLRGVEVVIAPPFPYLLPISNVIKKAKLGSQNMFWEDVGPYTGEVSWHHLRHIKANFVIIGHSERRRYCGETDSMINKKVKAALENGLTPILCIGENERVDNDIPAVVGEQLRHALAQVKKSHLKNLIVAYEPVWAISTTVGAVSDTPDNAFRALVYIRKILADLYGRKLADLVRVIYGGSVNAKNIESFLLEGKMQGALVGGASLDPKEFVEIIKKASEC